MIRARTLFLFALFGAMAASALAGPLRDLLAERRAAKTDAALAQDGVKVTRNIAYGADARQRFDVYAPAAGVSGAPVIFMVHGGAWRTGDKASEGVVRNKVARWVPQGYVVISTNYRLLPAADPVVQAQDVARALALAQQQARSWGGDPSRFILMGHSAGAHLVSLLASAPALAGGARWLGTVALDSAAMDVEHLMAGAHRRLHDEAFGPDPAFWKAASPLAQLGAAGQPFMAVCSTRRADACPQAGRYAARARELGMRLELLPQDLSHEEINTSLGLDNAYTGSVEHFMRALVQGGAP